MPFGGEIVAEVRGFTGWHGTCYVKGNKTGVWDFETLKKINIAMLAKQGWRLLNGDNPLVTSLMKAKYFPNTNFLDAQLGTNPSYMWRRILGSKEIIKRGSRRRIGDGESTDVWRIPWLPCVHNGYITTIMPHELENVQVANLMTENKAQWDDEILMDIFNDKDIELIKRIPVSRNMQQDSWYWVMEQSGLFTVKSYYRSLIGEQQWPYAAFWKKLWALDLPGKVTNFLWRVCKNVVPTAVALTGKRVEIDTKCSWCLLKEEDIEHVLFGCSFARDVWAKVGIQEMSTKRCQGSVWDVFTYIFNTFTNDKVTFISMIC